MFEFLDRLACGVLWCLLGVTGLVVLLADNLGPEWAGATVVVVLWLLVIRRPRRLAASPRSPHGVNAALLSPTQYEQHCARLLEGAGWRVQVIGAPGDQGVDLVAELRGWRVAVQCKHYLRSGVGNAAVQQVVAGKAHYGAQVAAVVTSGRYTAQAHALAKSNGVYLLRHEALPQLARIARLS